MAKKRPYRSKQALAPALSLYELRALLFWAAWGIKHAQGGSYPDAPEIVGRIAGDVGFNLIPRVPRFYKLP